MKAMWLEVPEHVLDERRRLGIDCFDEMWEGVYHMVPPPNFEHARIQTKFTAFLVQGIEAKGLGIFVSGAGVFEVGHRDRNYRVPDMIFIAKGREGIIIVQGIEGGGPDSVIEIRSPGDETYDKFPFFEMLACREVVVVDRDTKAPEVYHLNNAGKLVLEKANADGWIRASVLEIEMRRSSAGLEIRDAREPGVSVLI